MDTQHAPTPCHAAKNDYDTFDIFSGRNSDGDASCLIGMAINEVQADKMVRALNSYEALLEASKKMHREGHRGCLGEDCFMVKAMQHAEGK